MTVRSLSWILLLAALGLGAWWAFDPPAVQRWLPAALRVLPTSVQAEGKSGAAARKCQGATQVVYTDGPCPAGTREAAIDGGSVTVLPAVRPPAAATAAASAGSAQTPLRRLAGPDDSAAQRERVLEQALHR